MADRLYSLWYPNFRLQALPAVLAGVMRQFAVVAGNGSPQPPHYPINFTEAPTYQRIYVDTDSAPFDPSASVDPTATPRTRPSRPPSPRPPSSSTTTWPTSSRCAGSCGRSRSPIPATAGWTPPLPSTMNKSRTPDPPAPDDPNTPWKLRTHTVRILGFGPHFDVAGYEQNGHLLSTSASTPPGCWRRWKTKSSTRPPSSTSSRMSKTPRLHPAGREELRHLQPPALDRVGRTPRRKTHRPPPARQLRLNWKLSS